MAVNRKPGEKMYIDWVGDQPRLLTDVITGEIMRVHIFATTLGVSSMIYAEAFPNEKPYNIEADILDQRAKFPNAYLMPKKQDNDNQQQQQQP